MDLKTLSAVELAEAIRTRKVSSVEVVQDALNRLKAVHETCNAVISTDTEEALAAAKETDAAIASGAEVGALAGVPLAHKDMFDRAGKIPSWGARIRREKPCNEDNPLLARLKAAGSIQIAALHMTEFAFGPTGHNYVIGHARNPWDPSRIPGGSSSGSAICVAAGVVPAALGSDTAGSLRLPAAACNVTSLKPTWSRVSRAGAMPLSPSLDCVGPIARDVRDLALIMSLIAGHDPRDGSSSRRPVPDYLGLIDQPVDGIRIGVDERLIGEAHPEVQQRLEGAMKILERAGAKRVSVRFQDWRALDHMGQILQLCEVASEHRTILAQARRRLWPAGPRAHGVRAFHSGLGLRDRPARPRHHSLARADGDLRQLRHGHSADVRRSAAHHRRAGRWRRTATDERHRPRDPLHAPRELSWATGAHPALSAGELFAEWVPDRRAAVR